MTWRSEALREEIARKVAALRAQNPALLAQIEAAQGFAFPVELSISRDEASARRPVGPRPSAFAAQQPPKPVVKPSVAFDAFKAGPEPRIEGIGLTKPKIRAPRRAGLSFDVFPTNRIRHELRRRRRPSGSIAPELVAAAEADVLGWGDDVLGWGGDTLGWG